MTPEFFVSITSTVPDSWRTMVADLDRFDITEACVFVTGMEPQERQELYQLLDKTNLQRIPLVHLRHDSHPDEVLYFQNRWDTRLFNIHSKNQYPPTYDLTAFRDSVFVETVSTDYGDEPGFWAGICLDNAHVEWANITNPSLHTSYIRSLIKYPVGVAHISAFGGNPPVDCHTYSDLSQFDYVYSYLSLLPAVCALELENPIEQQLQAKTYLESLSTGK